MSIDLSSPIFSNEDAARKHFEALHWPNGPICPHCGVINEATELKGASTRPGLYKCRACEEQFSVTIGSVMESSHLPLTKWAAAFHLMASSKKGVSAHQLMRQLGIGSYRSAWFLAHRVREAMTERDTTPMGGEGSIVEIDETFIGRKEGVEKARAGFGHKNVVLSLVERGGSVRSFHVDSTRKEDILPIVRANVAKETHVMTDEANTYAQLGDDFAKHDAVDHGREEWGYTDRKTGVKINTNSIEGFYSVFKRGMKGVYQHCGEKHLHRYVAEFDFRHSNRVKLGVGDTERASRAIKGAVGKRLTYQGPRSAQSV
ncbi:MAG: IS1595 family transposase [Roseiarcus sp.]|jgi:transposase-like protein